MLLAYPAKEPQELTVISSPFRVESRILWGGSDLHQNYHAATPAQHWAYDIIVEPALHGSLELEAYGCWNKPVYAPIEGRIVLKRDGIPDNVPRHFPESNYKDKLAAMGNGVVIETGQGYLVMAHLRNGSVAVDVGHDVNQHTLIGACGNSGHSSEPHLHLHYQRQSPEKIGLITANPLPLYFLREGKKTVLKGGFSRSCSQNT